MRIPDGEPDVTITSVNFQRGIINIQYVEARETSDSVSIGRSMVIDTELVEEEVTEVEDLLRDIVDKGLLALRNPPQKVRARLRDNDENHPSSNLRSMD